MWSVTFGRSVVSEKLRAPLLDKQPRCAELAPQPWWDRFKPKKAVLLLTAITLAYAAGGARMLEHALGRAGDVLPHDGSVLPVRNDRDLPEASHSSPKALVVAAQPADAPQDDPTKVLVYNPAIHCGKGENRCPKEKSACCCLTFLTSTCVCETHEDYRAGCFLN